jgi:putative FmdB family regulatory protein
MPTYEYLCDACGRHQEQWHTMPARPAKVPCPCGAEAPQAILTVPEAFMRHRDYAFDRTKIVGNNGARFGRNVEQQHAGYRKHMDAMHKRIRGLNRSMSKNRHDLGGIRYVGSMPGEMVDSIGYQEGDKEAVVKDPETFLKKTGLYVGEGE